MNYMQTNKNSKFNNILNNSSLFSFLFFMIGLLGYGLCIPSFTYVPYSWQVVYPIAILCALLLWYIHAKHFRSFWLVVSTIIVMTVVFVLFTWEPMKEQFVYLINSLVGVPLTKEDPKWEYHIASINLPLSVIVVVFTVFLFSLEFVFHRHEIAVIFTMVLFLVTPVVGVELSLWAVLALSLFLIGFWVVHTSGIGKKKSLSLDVEKTLITKSSVYGVLLTLLFIAFTVPFVTNRAVKLYRLVHVAEQQVTKFVQSFTEEQPKEKQRYVSHLNLDPDGDLDVEVFVNEIPEEALYLRSFRGGAYRNSNWEKASDYEVFRTIRLNHMGKVDLGNWQLATAEDMADALDEMCFCITDLIKNNSLQQGEPVVVIQKVASNEAPRPYNSTLLGSNQTACLTGKKTVYRYFPQSSMERTWQYEPAMPYRLTDEEERILNVLDTYSQLQQWYLEEIHSYYGQVPLEELPKLSQIVRENPLTDLDEITTFIYYTLQSNTEYSRTPNFNPTATDDVVETFLFENQKGYCVHYATTAVLLYRLYGIPARYASGYVAFPEDFQENLEGESVSEVYYEYASDDENSQHVTILGQGDNENITVVIPTIDVVDKYKAELTDESAHAWVEIFIENYGWVPVEMTPLEEDDNRDIAPFLDRDVMEAIMSDKGWDMSVPSLSPGNAIPTSTPSTKATPLPENPKEDKLDVGKIMREFFVFLYPYLIVFAVVGLLILFVSYRRKWLLRKNRRRPSDKTYAVLIDMLHFAGHLKEYTGWEEEFLFVLCKTFPRISSKELEKLVYYAMEAAYGPTKQEFEKIRFVNKVYGKFTACIYVELAWYQKIIFKYLKVYG